jgi:hypothetical protein
MKRVGCVIALAVSAYTASSRDLGSMMVFKIGPRAPLNSSDNRGASATIDPIFGILRKFDGRYRQRSIDLRIASWPEVML